MYFLYIQDYLKSLLLPNCVSLALFICKWVCSAFFLPCSNCQKTVIVMGMTGCFHGTTCGVERLLEDDSFQFGVRDCIQEPHVDVCRNRVSILPPKSLRSRTSWPTSAARKRWSSRWKKRKWRTDDSTSTTPCVSFFQFSSSCGVEFLLVGIHAKLMEHILMIMITSECVA